MPAALSLVDVRKSYGPTPIIRGVTLDVRSGERHALIGPNGAGKSTLFNLISGRIPVTSGSILLGDRRIDGLRPAQIARRGLSRSFQITNIFAHLTVMDNLRTAVMWRLGYRYSMWRRIARLADVNERCAEVLQQIGLAARRDQEAAVLTYAEQRALELGLAIAGGADVLLLDEPMAGMSRAEAGNALNLLKRISVGKTLLVIEHDMGVVFDLADRISVLVYGEVIATGTPQEIRRNAAVQEAYLGMQPDEAETRA